MISVIIVIVFCFFCNPAAGLYYLAELVEEYTVVTKRIANYMIMVWVIYIYVSS